LPPPIFDHTSLREVVAEFNRYNTVQIAVASQEAGQIPVGGVFRIGDSTSFARAVAESHSLRVITHHNELVLEPAEGDIQPRDPSTGALSTSPVP
jgi:ferric-dicitrate binding protein FerR (iron transport regulator)